MAKVNNSIFMLARERLTANFYAELRKKKEYELILSENWLHVLEMLGNWFFDRRGPVQNESDFIEASKQVIDDEAENPELSEKIHVYYLLTHSQLEKRFPDYPTGDGFLEYLASREERLKKAELLEKTRIDGSICPYCESTKIRKDGNSFLCQDCHKRWRKKGYV